MAEKKKEVKEKKAKKTEAKQKKVKIEKKEAEEKAGKKTPEEKKKTVIKEGGEKEVEKKGKAKVELPQEKEEIKKVYRVKGSFLMGRKYQTFTKEVMASDPKEKIYSDFGSRHKVKRRKIKIEDVKTLKNDEITDRLLKQMVKMVSV